jgi:hypothetical protein
MKNPDQIELPHSAHSTPCSVLKYIFQNTMSKLWFPPDFDPIYLLQEKKNFYLLTSLPHRLTPFLINQPRFSEISFAEHLVTEQDVKEIIIPDTTLRNPKPFSIAVYTGFSYIGVKNQASKKQSALIGWHEGTRSEGQQHPMSHNQPADKNLNSTLHIFVTPSPHNQSIFLSVLNSHETHAKMCNIKNFYANPHFIEGESQPIPKKNKKSEGPLLNQRYCICEHPETGRFIVPGNRSFKSIGERFTEFNLEKFNVFF